MPEKIKDVKPPQGMARLAFRFPILLYRMGLGNFLGTRFLLLTHIGRKTGMDRKTVLEVVRYDKQSNKYIVAAGFGSGSDWYRNILVHPNVTVQCGNHRWAMSAHFLTPKESGEELVNYARRHPFAMRELVEFMGYRLDGTEADVRALGEILSMVVFKPENGIA